MPGEDGGDVEHLGMLDLEGRYGSKLRDREVGAKLLSAVNFGGRYPGAVNSSFRLARKNGKELIGKNDERRINAYLKRIDDGISKYGNGFEQRLWRFARKSLIVDPKDITDEYWRTKKRVMRDSGKGNGLTEYDKQFLITEIQRQQQESLDSWIDYLSREDCPYPTWFKIYVMDGISKMATFNNDKKIYGRRRKDTIAPYPHLNQAVLAKVYGAILDYYQDGTRTAMGHDIGRPFSDLERDTELEKLVKSGNFNKLYSYFLLSQKNIMKTPEKVEDIHGEWVEYGLDDEEAIANAADGTPWCIVTPSVARSYLSTGDSEMDYDDDGSKRGKAKFILFHLQDADGRRADNACASIRLDLDGNVAEVSGLLDGQVLEDSLTSIVEEKVRSLPGGEKYLRAFADRRMLIDLDRRMQANGDITAEELRFIWEMDRPIETVDTYKPSDSRILELRKKYNSAYAAKMGYIVPGLNTTIDDIEENLDAILAHESNLSSNLLIYILKKRVESGEGEQYMSNPQIAERIRNLETFETENYVFMLPKDKWSKKIALPKNSEGTHVAPCNLTAILKHPVESNYSEKWIRKEVDHFLLGEELLGAEEALLKPNGYHIPRGWEPIVEAIKKQHNYPGEVRLAKILKTELKIDFVGYVCFSHLLGVGDVTYLLSLSALSPHDVSCMSLSANYVNVQCFLERDFAVSVRPVFGIEPEKG